MKAGKLVWRGPNGSERPLKKMKTGHLQAVANILRKQQVGYALCASELPLTIPLIVQNRPVEHWLMAIAAVLTKRQNKIEKIQARIKQQVADTERYVASYFEELTKEQDK